MLLSHLLFLSLVCVTINGQVRGTFTCSRNPDAGATTSKAEAHTTNVGATTTKAGTTTTKAGTTTTKAGTPTNKAAATTTKSGATTNKAGMNKARACSNMSIIDGSLTDCTAIYTAGCEKSGIYNITPNGWTEGPFEAYCDLETLTVPNWNSCYRHGWTVFQRHVNGSVDFNRNWNSYKDGFGQLDHEFWLGNEKLHFLTKEPGTYRLRVDLVSNSGTTYHACYEEFHIKNEGELYKLHVSGFHDTNSLMDGLSDQNGEAFSTSDRDNTESANNCADITQGGWWHKKCKDGDINLNGVYGSIISSEMKIQNCISWY